jgi:hypothetical protein
MKFYVLMTSLALIAGTSLGYFTGRGSAESGFASGCVSRGVVVVYDQHTEEHRHFHCFELAERGQHPGPDRLAPSLKSGTGGLLEL